MKLRSQPRQYRETRNLESNHDAKCGIFSLEAEMSVLLTSCDLSQALFLLKRTNPGSGETEA